MDLENFNKKRIKKERNREGGETMTSHSVFISGTTDIRICCSSSRQHENIMENLHSNNLDRKFMNLHNSCSFAIQTHLKTNMFMAAQNVNTGRQGEKPAVIS